jgi:hypothetical protein
MPPTVSELKTDGLIAVFHPPSALSPSFQFLLRSSGSKFFAFTARTLLVLIWIFFERHLITSWVI